MQTVNVVEVVDGIINCLYAFSAEAEAEAMFTKMAQENEFSPEEIEVGLEDGRLDRSGYELYIVHSCN